MIIYLMEKIIGLTHTVEQLTSENEQLKSKLHLREAQLFGSKTETQASLEKKTKACKSSDAPAKTRKLATNNKRKRGAQPGHKGAGRKIPQNLPIVERIHQIPEDQQHCSICQQPLEPTKMSDDSYEVDVQVVYRLVKHVRKIYRKTCNCPGPLVSAPAPVKVIPKSKFSINFWTKVLLDKFLMNLPIHRQVFLMKLNNLHVSKGTITSAFGQLSRYLLPLYEQYRQESQQERRHHADETRWKIFIEIDGKKGFNWWLWTFVGQKVVFYLVDKSRSARIPKAHLKAMFQRFLNVDRYSAYKTLAQTIHLAFCWSHVRRDFTNILTRYPHKKLLVTWANQWIQWIGQLYAINKARLAVRHLPEQYAQEQKELEQAIHQMKIRSEESYALSEQQKVMASLRKHWAGLTLFVDYPDVPMDNNLAERMLRQPVVGRKNYYGNHSEAGGHFSAMMFTFIQTCMLNGLNPQAYLAYYLNECASLGQVPDNLADFMPHRLRENGPLSLRIEGN